MKDFCSSISILCNVVDLCIETTVVHDGVLCFASEYYRLLLHRTDARSIFVHCETAGKNSLNCQVKEIRKRLLISFSTELTKETFCKFCG